ncbi:MAG: biotin transporter BioY, partial [Megasphaera lornae]
AYIFQPTFGYLPGFILGTMVAGYIAEHLHAPTIKQLILADISGLFFVYLCGMVYLYLITTVYMGQPMTLRSLFLYCFFLAVPGDICLCIVAAILAKKLKHHGFSI